MANTVAGTHLTGTHASRPAGNAVPDGTLYSCTTHSLVYLSNYAGNSWSTWANLAGTGFTNPMANKGEMIVGDTAGAASALTAGTDRYVLTAAGAGNFPAWTAFSGARVYNSGTINLNNGSYTTITLDSEDYDTDAYHSTVSNTERLTIATTGKYRIGCGITISGTSSTTQCFCEIVKNVGPTPLAVNSHLGMTGTSINFAFSTEATLTATDYVWVRVFVNLASCTATRNSDWSPIVWIERIMGV